MVIGVGGRRGLRFWVWVWGFVLGLGFGVGARGGRGWDDGCGRWEVGSGRWMSGKMGTLRAPWVWGAGTRSEIFLFFDSWTTSYVCVSAFGCVEPRLRVFGKVCAVNWRFIEVHCCVRLAWCLGEGFGDGGFADLAETRVVDLHIWYEYHCLLQSSWSLFWDLDVLGLLWSVDFEL